ncbi:MAG: hypothetical protein IT364_21295 [Candidatus Hydrogenedentes bacterium]|nr:hypothetical protein [Candidatus Hydrogenedentota bacterium]
MKKMAAGMLKSLLGKTWSARLQSFMDAPRRDYVTERHLRHLSQAVARGAYASLLSGELFHSALNRHEMRVFSQSGEDGILLYLFSRIGSRDRRFIEFGVGDGRECNTANLALNFGWSGLVMDGSASRMASARQYYDSELVDGASTVKTAQAFVTAENADILFRSHGFEGELDLLSIDVDGNDYWIWKAIGSIRPRVVVVEYNAVFGPSASVTIPYNSEFRWSASGFDLMEAGASLTALTRLAAEKGYVLAGCNTDGVNAFFVRGDVASGVIEALTPERAYYPLRSRIHGLVLPVSESELSSRNLVRV